MANLLLDACVLINLFATDHVCEIARANNVRFVIVGEVADESFFLRSEDPSDTGRTPVNVLADDVSECLEVIHLTEDEAGDFVALAARLDDGEAATLAVALTRALPMATDDKAALRVIGELEDSPAVLRTSDLLRTWADSGVSADEVAAALAAIESRASFVPGPHDPNVGWWHAGRGD